MGSKHSKAKKKGQEEEQKTIPVDKDWSTSTWPRKKKPDFGDFKEEKSGTLGRRGKLGKGSTATLGNDSKLERKPSFGKRIRASARNWASTKGLYKGSKNQQEVDAETKPSSVILAQEEKKEEEVVVTPVENEVTTSTELDVGALVKELVTQKLKKSKEKVEEKENEKEEIKVEAQIEDVHIENNNEKVPDKIFPGFIEIDSNTAVATEFYPAENVSQSVCEEDVTAIELIQPGDEIVIATESIVEENENSYIEEKIEVIDNSAEKVTESVSEESVTEIDLIDEISMATECVVEENENSYIEEKVEVIENSKTSNDDNIDQHPVISDVSSPELLENTGDKETPETSIKAQHAFEISEVPTEVQMEIGENMDSTTPEISHIEEIEEASTIPVEIELEDDTNNTTNAVDIEDISIIVEDNLGKKEELATKENEEAFIENKHGDENVEHKEELDGINDTLQDDFLMADNSRELTVITSLTEMEVLSNEKIDIELKDNSFKLNAMMEPKDCDIAVKNDEKEEENIVEQSFRKLNNQHELKYITEEEEDDSLETAQEIESFELNEQVHEVTFEGSVQIIEFEDQPTKESLTQYEETPVLETVEEMEEPPMDESERVVLCENDISTEEIEEVVSHLVQSEEIVIEKDSIQEPMEIEQNAVLETKEEAKPTEEIEEVEKVVQSEEIEQQEPIEIEQNSVLEATPTDEIVDGFVVISDDYQDEDMSVDEIELSRKVTMEKKDTEEGEDVMSNEDNIDAQEELVLSEAEEIAQNILDRVFSEITDSAYFEGDDLEEVMGDQEEVSEECIEKEGVTVESEVLTSNKEYISLNEVSRDQDIYLDEIREETSEDENVNSLKEEAKNEFSGAIEENVELVVEVVQDDSLLFQVNDQNNTHDAIELFEEIGEVKQSSLDDEERLVCDDEEVKCVEKSEECCEEPDIEKDCDDHVGEDENDCKSQIDQENELLNQAMQDLSGKLGNTLKLVQEHISVTSDDIVEMEKSKTSDSDFSTFTNTTNIDYEVSEDGSDEERTDVSTDEGIVASSDEDEKFHGTKEAKEKLPKNKEDVKESIDTSFSEFK